MTHFRVVCAWCGWLLNQWAEWNVHPDRMETSHGICGICLAAVEEEMRDQSWFPLDVGEAGA